MNKTNIMVLVTQQKTCERLILNGYDLIKEENGKLYVVHVVNEKGKFLDNQDDGEALEYLFAVSKEVGAKLTVLRSKDIAKAIIDFAKDNDITHMVMGRTPENEKSNSLNFGSRLQRNLPAIDFVII